MDPALQVAVASALYGEGSSAFAVVQPLRCKRRKCEEPAMNGHYCEEHLQLVRCMASERQSAARARALHRGPPPVVLLTQTFDSAKLEDYDRHMAMLHDYVVTVKPDKGDVAQTPSMPNVQVLPGGVDLISGRWQELRLNFSMGLNMELCRHKVRARGVASPCAQASCTLLTKRHVEPHTACHTDPRDRQLIRNRPTSRRCPETKRSGIASRRRSRPCWREP
jgi:hypothetical protein